MRIIVTYYCYLFVAAQAPASLLAIARLLQFGHSAVPAAHAYIRRHRDEWLLICVAAEYVLLTLIGLLSTWGWWGWGAAAAEAVHQHHGLAQALQRTWQVLAWQSLIRPLALQVRHITAMHTYTCINSLQY